MTGNSPQKKMELLAPAGDRDSLLAALSAGADAVYIGGKAFSARQNAANFELPQIEEAVELLHLHRRKLYLTVNTLITDDELPEALNYLNQLYNLGVDGVIIQDLGLIRLARQFLPQLELHASTQMTIHNAEGGLFLKKLGLTRVVLARELAKEEVAAIVRATGMEIEVFVHGALCVCYSGQCLMSSMIGGRSGNRGRCAQPCRMEYQLISDHAQVGTEGNYLLSPRDLSLINVIPELNQAGVSSLKIEGRMKRPEYVFTVVRSYRSALDRFQTDPDHFRVTAEEHQDLSESFNRGFSTGYFGGNRNKQIMNFARPNNRGVYLGRISKIEGEFITVKLEADLSVGDLVEVWVSKGGRAAGTVETLFQGNRGVAEAGTGEIVKFQLKGKVYPGDRIFKVASAKRQQLTEAAIDPDNPSLKVGCTATVTGALDAPLCVTYQDPEGNRASAKSSIPLQAAKNRPLTNEVLWEQFGRLGNTPFKLVDLKNQLDIGLMLPLSELNQVRREAIEDLKAARLQSDTRRPVSLDLKKIFTDSPVNKTRPQPELSVWVADLPGVEAAAANGADLIYAGGDELTDYHWTPAALEEAIRLAHLHHARLVAGLPRINREGHRPVWEGSLKTVTELQPDGIIISDLGLLDRLLAEPGPPLFLNYPFNIFNSFAVTLESQNRIKQVTLSPELTLAQLNGILSRTAAPKMECLIHGPLELMISEYCPMNTVFSGERTCDRYCKKNQYFLRDRLNLDFPIFTDQFCRMHLLNSKDLCLYEDLPKFSGLPNLVLRLELKTFNANAVAKVVKIYRAGLDRLFKKNELADADQGVESLKSITGRGITKGHYFRGVE